jgi:hypothetical protein
MSGLAVHVPAQYWLTANRTVTNHGHRRAIIDALHELTNAAARAQRLPAIATPCIVTWTICYPKGVGKADPVNAHPTTKACLDALVPGWLTADDSTHVVEERFRRGANLSGKGVHVIAVTFEGAGAACVERDESAKLAGSNKDGPRLETEGLTKTAGGSMAIADPTPRAPGCDT